MHKRHTSWLKTLCNKSPHQSSKEHIRQVSFFVLQVIKVISRNKRLRVTTSRLLAEFQISVKRYHITIFNNLKVFTLEVHLSAANIVFFFIYLCYITGYIFGCVGLLLLSLRVIFIVTTKLPGTENDE